MLYISHDRFGEHETPPGHPERRERYLAVEAALSDQRFAGLVRAEAPVAAWAAVERAHGADYVETLRTTATQIERAPEGKLAQLDPDTWMGRASLDAALRGAGGAVAAVDAVCGGTAQRAFVAARPPGHHAEPGRAMGFCLLNNVVIAALHARAAHGLARIAVVDFDVHHGNGTQAMFWNDEAACFLSSHEWPQYPGTGRVEDRGAFETIHNAPLPPGTDGTAFRRAWGERLLPALDAFAPDFVAISAGFDAHLADPIGGFELIEDDFEWITREIVSVARTHAQGRVVSVLEGGYDLAALGASVAAHVAVLMEA